MIQRMLKKVIAGKDLHPDEAKAVFQEILEAKLSDVQIAAFLTALRLKGESVGEIYAAASIIRQKARRLHVRETLFDLSHSSGSDEAILDTCGTGGSGVDKFNISTACAFVMAGAGIKVAKHGNRAMSSSCGSGDVLEALGINISLDPAIMERAIKKVGIGFLYAPLYHPALKSVAGIRREMGLRTIFNILGPLCNPAGANYQLLGVYAPELTVTLAKVLRDLGTKKAFVVCSDDLKDEVTLTGRTKVSFLNKRRIENSYLTPRTFGLKKCRLKSIQAKNAYTSAAMIRSVFAGKASSAKDVVLANAACCFYILGRAKSLREGVGLARCVIESGAAKKKFHEFKRFLKEHE